MLKITPCRRCRKSIDIVILIIGTGPRNVRTYAYQATTYHYDLLLFEKPKNTF